MVRITLRRSLIGTKPVHRACVATLGLRKVGQSVVRPWGPELEGLLRRIRHLVEVEPVAGAEEPRAQEGRSEDATADR
ncbi:MAG: 50S ribosomal protein L30 [candidate division GAL15 bacterium]